MATINQPQYLTGKELSTIRVDLGDFVLLTSDSFNESLILEKLKLMNEKDVRILILLAFHFAIVGTGGKNYGKIKIDGVDQEVSQVMNKIGVLHSQTVNSKLAPTDLTLKRLSRFFRYQISDYIKANNQPSYLFRKYCNVVADHSLVFPGAEHMVTGQDALNLLSTYENVDNVLGTKFGVRIKTIFQARGLKLVYK